MQKLSLEENVAEVAQGVTRLVLEIVPRTKRHKRLNKYKVTLN